jgi:hypothetical protein
MASIHSYNRMSVTVIPTERDRAGNPVERRDKAQSLPDRAAAELLLSATVGELMKRAGMRYDPSRTLEENTAAYYDATGHAFGWIIEGIEVEPSPVPTKIRWSKLAYLLFMAGFALVITAVLGKTMISMGILSEESADRLLGWFRAATLILLAIGMFRFTRPHR